MKSKYPYLKDPRAISEIRKHQWIESEKAGREIGFGTAAIDWISKFGRGWEEAFAKIDKNAFIENRKYRRFPLETFATLIHEDKIFKVRTININPQGVLCAIDEGLEAGRNVILQWSFEPDGKSGVTFRGRVLRAWLRNKSASKYELLIKFDEASQKEIESFKYLLNA